MKLLKPTAYFLLIAVLSLTLASCDRDADLYVRKEYRKDDVPLTGAVTGASIHGMAPTGFAANPVQNFITSSNLSSITRCATVSTTSCGSVSGRLFADGVVVTEENILNGVYYVSIRTAANPMGEIRAQIKF